MAKTDNLLLKHASGTIGKMITISAKRSGATILGAHRKPSTVPLTPAQLEVQERFKKAKNYAKAVLANPDQKAAYKAVAGPDQSAYNMAMRDAFKAPEIHEVDFSGYHGLPGDGIYIQATDDFKVASVSVSIVTAAGALVEEGAAVLQANGDWLYTTTVANNNLPGTEISATARDLPANQTTKAVVV